MRQESCILTGARNMFAENAFVSQRGRRIDAEKQVLGRVNFRLAPAERDRA